MNVHLHGIISRSRLVMLDGNMYFHAAREKNISFVAGTGGSIYFGDKNLNLLPELVCSFFNKSFLTFSLGQISILFRQIESLEYKN